MKKLIKSRHIKDDEWHLCELIFDGTDFYEVKLLTDEQRSLEKHDHEYVEYDVDSELLEARVMLQMLMDAGCTVESIKTNVLQHVEVGEHLYKNLLELIKNGNGIQEDILREFEIWCEGYKATGESGTAYRWDTIIAKNFKEACMELARHNKNFSDNFNPNKMTYWGCKLFDNEKDARKSFG